MRTFIAFDLASEAKNQIEKIQLDFKKLAEGKIKYTASSQLHLTVFFIGDIEQNQADKIKNLITKINFPQFYLEMSTLGYFPNIRKPNVIVLKSEANPELNNFVKSMDNSLAELGFKRDKKWVPHVTIGRVKEPFKMTEFKIIPFKIKIESLSFYKSTLTSSGPVYENIAVNTLQKGLD